MKKIIFLIGLVVITFSSFAQIGINTTAPDSSAVLDLNANNKGLLIPSMTTTQREAMQASPPTTGLADGLLVYDTNYKRFYFWDISIQKWVALNNWRKEYTTDNSDAEHVTILFLDTVETGSNLGIGEASPNSKLTVNGNISVGNTNTVAPTNGTYVDGQVRIGAGAGTTEKLEIDGNTNITGTSTADEFIGKGITPVGGIIMYSGATDATLFDASGLGVTGSKMEGWALCNGSNSTPDLRDRFVVGAGNSYTLANTGGEDSHVLTIDEMPSHNHTGTTSTDGSHTHGLNTRNFDDKANGFAATNYGGTSTSTASAGEHNHTLNVDYTGSDQAHENRPPYYAVYYIIRLN